MIRATITLSLAAAVTASDGSGSGSGIFAPEDYTFCSESSAACNCNPGRKVLYGVPGNFVEKVTIGTLWCGPGAFGVSVIADANCFCEDGEPQPHLIPGCEEKPSLGWIKCGVDGVTCNCSNYGISPPTQIRYGCNNNNVVTNLPVWNSRFCSDNANLNPSDQSFPPLANSNPVDCACGCDAEWTESKGCCRFGGSNDLAPITTYEYASDVSHKKAKCRKACENDDTCVTFEFSSSRGLCELYGTTSDSTTYEESAVCSNSKCFTLQCSVV